jgi:ATP-dependent DNA ligase
VTLDTELLYLRSDGRPDFARLRHRLTGSATPCQPAMLQVFDVLHLEGFSTRGSQVHRRVDQREGVE